MKVETSDFKKFYVTISFHVGPTSEELEEMHREAEEMRIKKQAEEKSERERREAEEAAERKRRQEEWVRKKSKFTHLSLSQF